MDHGLRIAIVGGGIVGLSTAISLARVGFKPVVYEAVRKPEPLGVGINLLPHAVRELTELGLLAKVSRAGVLVDELVYRMADGRVVWTEPRGLAAGYDWPQIAIHRGRFQMLLLDEARALIGDESLRFGHALTAVEPVGNVVMLHFMDRVTGQSLGAETADVVIAADGIHSAVRKQFNPAEGIPKWSGVSLFRGATTLAAGTVGPTMNWTGHSRQKFVGYPISIDERSGEILFNFICDIQTGEPGSTPREDWNRKVDATEWLGRYANWKWPGVDVTSVVGGTQDIYEFPMVDRDPLPRWTHGRITLAGDAAHPMYPIGSNGATQGLIDSRALAFHLATAPTPGIALARYEEERREPTSRIVLANRALGPDRVLEIARERAGSAGSDLDSAFPMSEREAISLDYKSLAAFNPQQVRARRSYTPDVI